MTIEQKSCDECGHQYNACPNCDGRHVTPFEMVTEEYPHSYSVMNFIRQADRGDSATFKHVCWDCGWDEEWTITVD